MKKLHLITILLIVSSCSKIRTLEDRTKSMTENTEAMKTTTVTMQDKTSELEAITSHMYPQIRTKETEDTRSKKMAVILSKDAGFGQKVAAAAVYFQSFEFQFWNNNNTFDTEEVREKLFLDATNEFYRRMVDIYKDSNIDDMSPLNDDTSKHNLEMAFYALSAAVHMNNHHQEYIAEESVGKNRIFTVTSFYDLLKSAVAKDREGEELKEYEKVVVAGKNLDITEVLIRNRFNILTALAIDDMINQKEVNSQSLLKKVSALMAKLTKGKVGSIKLTSLFANTNDATRFKIIEKLDGAMKAKRFLEKYNISYKLDSTLKNIIDNLQIEKEEQNLNELVGEKKDQTAHYLEIVKTLKEL